MGTSGERQPETHTGHMPVPLDIANKVLESICKITIGINEERSYGTGFFMNYSDKLKCLMTNYHVINTSVENKNIEIEIHNKKKMKLKFKNRYTKYIEKPKDIAMIEIKESDEIYKDIIFLDSDYNCVKSRYIKYKGVDVFSIQHPYGKGAACASGTIKNIYEHEFDHNISTDNGSSGCPIILLNNNINLIRVIGIHKDGIINKKINGGTFIGEIFNGDLNKELNKKNNNNYIIAEIDIKGEDINKDIRIINSYKEDYRRSFIIKIEEEYKNEEEIKKCEIKINNELIPFNYFYKFKSKGKYIIQYTFKNNINKTCFMFDGCSSLTNIDLSNFNTNNITSMGYMFSRCSSLINIDLSNFNTNNVTDMGFMFWGCSSLINVDLSNFNTNNLTNMRNMFDGCSSLTNIDLSNFNTNNLTNMRSMFNECSSLTNIDLSNFNTNNVTDMKYAFNRCSSLINIDLSNFNNNNVTDMGFMFSGCSSLTNINLSNFNTNNVTDMNAMFFGCSSLTNIDLSNFNTINVTGMGCMFSGCSSLININLSNFNTNKVTNMVWMFCDCSSLTNIDLSNFNTNNVTDMAGMFLGCSSLKKENIITKDKRILKGYEV